MRPSLILVIVLFVLISVQAQPKHQPTPSPTSIQSPGFPPATPIYTIAQSRPAAITEFSGRSAYETQLGWGILAFGFLIVGLEVLVMLKLQKGWGIQSTRMVGLTLVLTSGLFLIVTGYSQEQIAPMIGLLGTITGFLLGKTSSSKEADV